MNQTDFARKTAVETGEPESVFAGISPHLLTAINMLNLGILVVDREGRITFANCAAADLLKNHGGTNVRRPPPADAPGSTGALDWRLRQAIARPERAGDRHLMLPAARDNPLIVRIVPCRSEAAGVPDGSISVLFITDPTAAPDVDMSQIGRLYGLTRAELRLLEALIRGCTIRDYASQARISLNTVKGHLKQVFSKTDTSRQSELMVRVLANPVFRLVPTRSLPRGGEQGASP